MFLALVPLFDDKMAVRAYSVFSQKDNFFLDPMMMGSRQFDGATSIPGLELIRTMGIETISKGEEIFVPVSNVNIFSDVESQCTAPHNRIAFLIDNTIPPQETYVNRLKELKRMNFKLAVRKLAVADFESYREILKLADYVFLDSRRIAIEKAKVYFGTLFPTIMLCAGGIENMESFEMLKEQGGYQLYEGDFYRVPLTKGSHEVAPLKLNYIELLNIVNNSNFELTDAADIIGRDTALTISLLQMVNRMTVNSGITSIRHAAAMLGQKELKRWINTAVVNEMYSDKPSEVTRLSLLRAKFAEYLGSVYGLQNQGEELFLMGLFSVLDVILEKTMKEALEMVKVSKDIEMALIYGKGRFFPVYNMMLQYENASWNEVSRLLLLENKDVTPVNEAYLESLRWYRDLMSAKV